MKKIALSLMTIMLVGVVSFGATNAYFSDTATVEDNTFATGVLEIRVNAQPSIIGFTFDNAAPGDCTTKQFNVNNYGAPWFAGDSTLTAKYLTLKAQQDGGETDLYNALTVKVEVNRGWPTWETVYDAKLKNLNGVDLLSPRWTELIPGSSEDVKYTVCLPNTGNQTALQGKSTTFDLLVEGRTN